MKYGSTGSVKKPQGIYISGILNEMRKEPRISSPGSAASSSRPMISQIGGESEQFGSIGGLGRPGSSGLFSLSKFTIGRNKTMKLGGCVSSGSNSSREGEENIHSARTNTLKREVMNISKSCSNLGSDVKSLARFMNDYGQNIEKIISGMQEVEFKLREADLHSNQFYEKCSKKPGFSEIMREKEELLNADSSDSGIQEHIRYKIPKEKKELWEYFRARQSHQAFLEKQQDAEDESDSYYHQNRSDSSDGSSKESVSSLSEVSTQYYDSKITQYTAENVARKKKQQGGYKGRKINKKRVIFQ